MSILDICSFDFVFNQPLRISEVESWFFLEVILMRKIRIDYSSADTALEPEFFEKCLRQEYGRENVQRDEAVIIISNLPQRFIEDYRRELADELPNGATISVVRD